MPMDKTVLCNDQYHYDDSNDNYNDKNGQLHTRMTHSANMYLLYHPWMHWTLYSHYIQTDRSNLRVLMKN